MKKMLLTVPVVALGLSLPFFGGISAPTSVASAAASNVILAQQTQAVTIQNFAFSPASLTVSPGTTVTWTNKDSTAHTVTIDSGSGPNSGQIQPGQSYSFTFQQSGTYAYHCSIHPQMKATVVVSSSPSSGQAPSTTPQPSGGTSQQQMNNTGGTPAPSQSATGPVAAGEGSVATNQYLVPLAIGTAALIVGVVVLLVRHLRLANR